MWNDDLERLYQDVKKRTESRPAQPPVEQNTSTFQDFGTDLKRGVQQVPSAITGLLDIPVGFVTGKPLVSQGWDEVGKLTGFQPKKWADEARAEYSPERQELQRQADAKEGFFDTAAHYIANPSLIAGTVVESAPSLALGGVYGRALKGVTALGGIARGGIGEGAVMAGQSMTDMLDQGVDARTAAGLAASVGVIGGAIGVGGGMLAQRMGLIDPDTLAAGGLQALGSGQTPLGLARRVAGGMVSEGLFEEAPQTAVETLALNYGTGQEWDTDLGKNVAVGALAGAAMGGGFNLMGRSAPEAPPPAPPAPETDLFGAAVPPIAPPGATNGVEQAPLDVAALRDEYANLAAQARMFQQPARESEHPNQYHGQNNKENLTQVTQRMSEIRKTLQEANVPVEALNLGRAEERVKKLDKDIAAAQASYEKALVDAPEKAPAIAEKINALTATQDRLRAFLTPQQGQMDLFASEPNQVAQGETEIPATARDTSVPEDGLPRKKDGTLREYAQKAYDEYSSFSDLEIESTIDALSADKNAGWRIRMLEGILNGRRSDPNAQAVEVDSPSVEGQGSLDLGGAEVSATGGRSSADSSGSPGGTLGRGQQAGVVGSAPVQQPTDLTGAQNGQETPDAALQGQATAQAEGQVPDAAQGQDAAGNAAGQTDAVQERRDGQGQEGLLTSPEAPREVSISAASGINLPEVQKQVFDHLVSVVQNGGIDDVVDAQGTLQYEKIGKALGKKRGSVKAAVDKVVEKIAAANGMTVEEAKASLRDQSTRTTEVADYDNLGLSPAVQRVTVNEADIYGTDSERGGGAEQTMEIVASPGQTNANPFSDAMDTGNEAGTEFLAQAGALGARGAVTVQDTADPVAERRAAENHARNEAQKDQVLSAWWSAEAMEEWDSTRTDGAPTAAELDRDSAYAWMVAYGALKYGEITLEQLDAEQREIERDFLARPRGVSEANAVPVGVDAGAVQLGSGQPAIPERVAAPEPGAREPAAEETTGTVPADVAGFAVTPTNPLEARVAALRAKGLTDQQSKRLDRILGRYSSGDQGLDWLMAELETLEGVVTPAPAAETPAAPKATVVKKGRRQIDKGAAAADGLKFSKGGLSGRGRRRMSPNAEGTTPEAGALPGATDQEILVYYADAENAQDLYNDTAIGNTGTPGLEVVRWGASSGFGPASDILTHGVQQRDGSLYFYVTDARAVQEAGEIGITTESPAFLDQTSLIQVMARPVVGRDNVWEIGVQGPAEKSLVFERLGPDEVSVLPDPDPTSSEPYTRLEGVPRADTLELLKEVRRRITRFQGGRVPNVVFTRETGALVGKRGFVTSDVVRRRYSVGGSGVASSVDAVRSAINEIGTPTGRRKVTVVQTAEELIQQGVLKSSDANGVQGFVDKNGNAYFIAENIPQGSELAVILHEIGAHLGIEALLTPEQYEQLVSKIFQWAQSDANTLEARIARAALVRVEQANVAYEEHLAPEVIAYFIEEAVKAGVNPTAMNYKSELGRWFRTMWAAFKTAIRRLGIINADKLTAQNVVDLAYGAARISLTGQLTGKVPAKMMFSRAASEFNANPTPQGLFDALRAWGEDRKLNVLGGLRNARNKSLTLEQLAEVAKEPSVDAYRRVMVGMQMDSKQRINEAAKIDVEWAKLYDKANWFSGRKANSQATMLSEVMREATREQYDPEKDGEPKNPQQEKIAELWEKLEPETRALYVRVREFYEKGFEERKKILMEAASKAKKAGANTREVDRMFAKMKGPYFPLMRLGKYYSVGMSAELAALMEKQEAGTASSAELSRIERLRKDEKHFVSSGYQTRAEAARAAEAHKRTLGYGYYNEAEKKLASAVSAVPDVAAIEAHIAADLPPEMRESVRDMLTQMYFDLLPEHHALKSAMKRTGAHGEEADMRRVFAASATRLAHHISRMKNATDLSEAMQKVRQASRKDEALRNVYNTLVEHAALSMDPNEGNERWVSTVMTTSYLANLGLSPAFILTNLTQVPMITYPWLSARFGWGATSRAMAAALADVTKLMKVTYGNDKFFKGGWRSEFDWTSMFPEGSGPARMFTEMLNRNLLDITMEHDLGAVAEMRSGAADQILKVMNTPVRLSELANRALTALTAYRLSLAKDGSHDKAVEMAAQALSKTQLDYSYLNAPFFMKSVMGSKSAARIMMQFRKYQQGMLYLIIKSMVDAVRAKGATPEETKRLRREAGNTVLGIFATTGLMAGTLGMPMVGVVVAVANALGGDDDEPWDAEAAFRNMLKEEFGKETADVLAKGVSSLFGVNMDRVGMANLLNPLPIVQRADGDKQKAINYFAAAVGGAPLSTAASMYEGLGLMADGDVAKGAEKVLPLKAAQNIVRAARYESEGLTDKNGNVVLPDEKFSAWDIVLRGMGFQTTKETDYYEAAAVMGEAKDKLSKRRTSLLNDYVQARLAGLPTTEVDREIAAFNEKNPEKGVRIDASTKLRSLNARRLMLAERNEAGVRVNKQNAPYADLAGFAVQ